MTAVPGQHRTTTRLTHVTNIKPLPAGLRCRDQTQLFDHVDQLWVAPIAVARQTHGLPCGAGFGQLFPTSKTSLGIGPIGSRALTGGKAFGPKQVLRDHIAARATGGSDGRQHFAFATDVTTSPTGPKGQCESCTNQKACQDHLAKSPSRLTHANRMRPMRNRNITGDIPICALPLMVVTIAISSGAMNAVARPDRP